ncbi:hypothetical protein ACWCO0_23105 [Streptomyces tubercidicus]
MADRFTKRRSRTSHVSARQRAAAAATVLSFALLASGCGDPQVNYAIPRELCGVAVEQDLLRPLFPPGDKVEFDGDSLPDANTAKSFCQYYVDGNTSLSVDGRRSSEKVTAAQLVRRYASHAHLDSWARSDGSIAGYSGSVFGTTSCSGALSDSDGQPARVFTLNISVNHFTSTKAVRPDLEKLMITLLPKAAHAKAC